MSNNQPDPRHVGALGGLIREDLKRRTIPANPVTGLGGMGLTEHDLARTILDSTDPAVLDAMEDALVRAGRLTVTYGWRDRDDPTGIWQPGYDLPRTRLAAGDLPVVSRHSGTWREVQA